MPLDGFLATLSLGQAFSSHPLPDAWIQANGAILSILTHEDSQTHNCLNSFHKLDCDDQNQLMGTR